MSGTAPKVFLSYRREDAAAHAGWLHDMLEAELGDGHVFIDADLEFSENFVQRITRVLDECQAMVVVIGPRWAAIENEAGRPRLFESRDFVRFEVEKALQRGDVRVVPVLIAGARMPDPEQLPESLRTLPEINAIELSDNLRRRRDDVRDIMATVQGPPDPAPEPAFFRRLIEGLAVAAAAGLAGGVLGSPLRGADDDRVAEILSTVTHRAVVWAVVGAAIAAW